jgi:hypothetical protein
MVMVQDPQRIDLSLEPLDDYLVRERGNPWFPR